MRKQLPNQDFGDLVRRHQDMAFALALSALGHVQQAEDAAQEAFVEAYVALPTLRAPAAFTSWFRVILQRSIARVRTRTWYSTVPLPEEKTIDLTPTLDLRLEVMAGLKTLPPRQREAVILHYLGGYTAPELAVQLGVPLTTIKKRLADARRALRTRMEHLMESTLHAAAPSANDHFATRVLRLIQPESLKSDTFVAWSGGIGTQVWSLFRAAMTGDLPAVQDLLARDPNLVHSSCDYRTALHFAVRENQPAVVACLLAAGADATLPIGSQDPLGMARERSYTEVAALLERHLAHKYRIDARAEPLSAAIRQRDTAAVEALLDADPTLLHAGDGRGNQAIHWATMTRNLPLIDRLLERGADINAARPNGARPLDLTNGDYFFRGRRDVPASTTPTPEAVADHLLARGADDDLPNAAKRGDLEQVRALLASGRTVTLPADGYCTYYSGTPLRNAAERGHLAVVQLLLEHGANPNEPEPGIAPFGGALYAAAAGGHLAIARLLLEHGANPSQTMESSGSALSRAKMNQDQPMIELLASYGGITGFANSCYYNDVEVIAAMLSVDPTLAHNTEALDYALSENHEPVVRLLLRCAPETAREISADRAATPALLTLILAQGADPNFVNWLGVTPLHNLASAGALERAGILLDHGAAQEALDEEYRSTPLGWAAREGRTEMVRFLLERGASLVVPGQPDWAHPHAWATRRGHREVAALLERQQGSGRAV